MNFLHLVPVWDSKNAPKNRHQGRLTFISYSWLPNKSTLETVQNKSILPLHMKEVGWCSSTRTIKDLINARRDFLSFCRLMLKFESYAPQVWNVWWKMYFRLLPNLHRDQNIHPAFISIERPWQEGTGCALHIKYLSDRSSGMRRRLERQKWNHGGREDTGTVICLVTEH